MLPADLNVPGYLLATAHNIWMNQLREGRPRPRQRSRRGRRHPTTGSRTTPCARLLLAEQRTRRAARHCRPAGAPAPRARAPRARRSIVRRDRCRDGHAHERGRPGRMARAHPAATLAATLAGRRRSAARRSAERGSTPCPTSSTTPRIPARPSLDRTWRTAGNADERSLRIRKPAPDCVGSLPFIPIVAIAARMGTALRAGAEAPLSIGTAAAVTAAVVATAGGGGALVARYTATTSASASAPRTLVHHPSQIVAASATALVIRRASGHDRSSSVSAPTSIPRPHPTRARLPVMRAAAVPARPPASPAPKPGPTLPPPKPAPASPPGTIDTQPARTADEDGKPKQEAEAKTPPGQAKTAAAGQAQTKTPPGQAKKTAAGQTDSPVTGKLPPGQERKDSTTASAPGNAAHGNKHDTEAADATTPTPASEAATTTTGDSGGSALKSHGRAKGTPSSPSTDPIRGGRPAAPAGTV